MAGAPPHHPDHNCWEYPNDCTEEVCGFTIPPGAGDETSMAPPRDTGDPVANRKKLKASDLPLSSSIRAEVDGLAHRYKKKGGYDQLRQEIWRDMENNDFETPFKAQLLEVAETEVDKNPHQLLKLDRSKATLLLEGAVERTPLYQDAESLIDEYLDKHMAEIEVGIRALRAQDIGQEAADAEHARGSKTDAQYEAEAAERREAREQVRIDRNRIADDEEEERRNAARERRREREREDDARRLERETRRKAEREEEEKRASREKERDRDRDRERVRDRDRDRDVRDRDRHRDRDHDRIREDRYRRRGDSPRRSSISTRDRDAKPELTKEEIARLEKEAEKEALDDLLKEGKKVAQRSSRHQLELDIDKTLAPPPRKTMPASAIKPISRDSPSKTPDVKKIPTAPKAARVDADGFKTPLPKSTEEPKLESRERRSTRRSRSRERGSSRRSTSRSRRRDGSRDRDTVRSARRDSRDRDRDSVRPRRDSRDRDDRSKRRDSRDRDRKTRDDRDTRRERSPSRSRADRRRSYRSRSRSRDRRVEREHDIYTSPRVSREEQEAAKVKGIRDREAEAKAWEKARMEAEAVGKILHYVDWERERNKPKAVTKDGIPTGPAKDVERAILAVARPRDERSRDDRSSRDRRRSRERSRSRPATGGRRGSRIERSTSPPGIDRYVPGGGADRSTVRDRSRDRDRRTRDERDETKRKRSRSRSRSRDRSRRRDRSRDRDRDRKRSRSRGTYDRRDTRRDRSRSRDRDRERRRSRSRDKDRDRERRRSRSRGSRRESRR